MKPRLLKIAAALIVLALALCLFLYSRSIPAVPLPAATNAARDAAAALNTFGFDLYAKLRTRPGNLSLSPYSIHTALAMAHAGAAHVTADQFAAALHLTAASQAGQRDLNTRLQAPGNHGIELAAANRLWLDKHTTALPAFTATLANDFLADAASVDFAGPDAISSVNAWTSRHTHAKIPTAIGPADVSGQTALLLTNALYFKGNWDIPFKKSDTAEGDFFPAPGLKVRAMLMKHNKEHAYAFIDAAGNTPAFQALSLDYTQGDLAMLILLPQLGALDQLENALDDQLLATILKQLHEMWLPVTLPRFTINDSFSLAPALQTLGITAAFDPKSADFSNLRTPGPEPLFLTAVFHKTFIEVNEQGTEAAAITTIPAGHASVLMMPPDFKADHPFLFLLRDKGTGTILFLGRLSAP